MLSRPWGDHLVGHITSSDVLAVLTPIWTDKPETARRVRQRIGVVMDWAIAQGYRDDNPAGAALAAVLPKLPRTAAHHKASPYLQVPPCGADHQGFISEQDGQTCIGVSGAYGFPQW